MVPAATTKNELETVLAKEFAKLTALCTGISDDQAMAKDDDDVSIKDIVGHRAHWIGLFLGWYTDGAAGNEVFFPAEGYKWSDLNRFNADLRAAQTDLGWADAQAMLDAAHRKLVEFVGSLADDELYGRSMAGAKNDWTPGRWAEAAGPSHYRSAAKYLRARLRAQRSGDRCGGGQSLGSCR